MEICCAELDLIRVIIAGAGSLLTLTRGPVSLATMASEPASHLLAVGSGLAGNDYLFYIGC
jgi:hypothetical protein